MKQKFALGAASFLFGAMIATMCFFFTHYSISADATGVMIENVQYWEGNFDGWDSAESSYREQFEENLQLYLEEQLTHWGKEQGTPEEVIGQIQHGIAEGDYYEILY